MTERIGRYDLVRTLAEGDRGKLYLARTTGYGNFARHVVIKTFEGLPGAAEGAFLEETAHLGRLHHQHITPVLDVGRDGDRFFVALDFVHGRSAREVLQQALTIRALLPLDFCLAIVAAIAAGLHHAHTRRLADAAAPPGLVHGHVSLSNILVGFDGTIQLAGFVGASVRGLRATDTQLGFSRDQLAYLAPEQARRTNPIDARADVFALGTVLYELTTMSRAFRDDSDRLTIERVKAASYRKPRSFLPDYPPALERIITRALELDPAARYPDADLLRRELLAVGHGLDLVLNDTAVIDVMAQLFDDSGVDPWTSQHAADNAPDTRAAATPPAPQRKLRAATESVDALAIELEIELGIEPPAEAARALPLPAPREPTTNSDDSRVTDPLGQPVASEPGDPVRSDTDGVPVLNPLPVKPAIPLPERPTATPALPPARRGSPSFRTIAILAGVATIAITATVALALRGTGSSRSSAGTNEPPSPRDGVATPAPAAPAPATPAPAAPAPGTPGLVAGDASPPSDATPHAPLLDAAPPDAPTPDASTTVRLRITSTPANGTVLLDGKKLGKTPYDGVVDRADGKHLVKVRLSGHVSGKLDIALTGDVEAHFELKPAAASPPASDEPSPP